MTRPTLLITLALGLLLTPACHLRGHRVYSGDHGTWRVSDWDRECEVSEALVARHKGEVVALVFVTANCPITTVLAPEIERVHQDLVARGGRLELVYVDDELSSEAARADAERLGITAPVLREPGRHNLGAYGVTEFPQAAVFRLRTEGSIARCYTGRIDDRYALSDVKHGSTGVRAQAHRHDLRDGVDAAFDRRYLLIDEASGTRTLVPIEDE